MWRQLGRWQGGGRPARRRPPPRPLAWLGRMQELSRLPNQPGATPTHGMQDSSASAAVLTTPPSQAEVRRGGKKGGAVATMEVPKVEADALERQVDAKEGLAAGSGSLTDVELGLELQPSTSPQPGP